MLSKAMEVALKACFRNHLYQFEGKVFRQCEGGPIGLRLSIAVSRIVMAMWDKQLAQLGAESGWIIHLLKRYVDDITAICETLKMGVRWTMPSPRVANVSDVFVSDKCESLRKKMVLLLLTLHSFHPQEACCTRRPGRQMMRSPT